KKNSFSVLFAKTATSKKLIQLSQGSYEISFSLLDAQSSLSQVALPLEVEGLSASESMKVLKNLSSTITYDEVFKGVKLRYTVLPERLKEDIILTSVDAIQDFRFIYQTKNLSMEEFEGQVVFKDTETGKDIFFLEPPHMMDSAGEISTDITLQLTKSEEGMILTLRPFHGMLAASGVGFVGQMIGGAILSMSSNATNQIITNNGFNDFNLGEMFIDGLIGGLSNRFAGRGMGKSVNIKTLNRNLTKKMLSGSADTISRGVKYYLSQTSKNYFSYLIVPMIKSTLTSLAGNAVVIGIGRE
ncbi:MAG: hypothetical protein Q8O06_03670, partial [Acetobacterium sp.]|nr:hypothetical protein [Acetobacterium sp.]